MTDNQILKCRDDKDPVILEKVSEQAEGQKPFKMAEGCESSWLKKDTPVGAMDLRPRIEPWLTALFQSEHLALLVGSGLSHAVHRIATGAVLPGMNAVKFTHFDTEINVEAKKSAEASGREAGNIEDQIRVANELLRGLEIIASSDEALKKKAAALKQRTQERSGEFCWLHFERGERTDNLKSGGS